MLPPHPKGRGLRKPKTMTPLRKTFLLVMRGKALDRSNSMRVPNRLMVPTPVRSLDGTPFWSTSRRRFSYWHSPLHLWRWSALERNASCSSADSNCIGGGLSFVVAFGEMGGGEMPTGRGVPCWRFVKPFGWLLT